MLPKPGTIIFDGPTVMYFVLELKKDEQGNVFIKVLRTVGDVVDIKKWFIDEEWWKIFTTCTKVKIIESDL